MRAPTLFPALFLAACGGGNADPSTVAPLCDDLETEVLGMVSVEAWPAGTPDALDLVENIDGRYAVDDSCQPGVPTYVKILVNHGSALIREQVELVTTPYSESPCGCTTDASYGPDSDLTMVAFVDTATFFIEDPWFVATSTGPGANVTVDTPLTVFGESSLVARSCASYEIDPFQSDLYDSLDLVFRVESAGQFTATYTLVPLGDGEPMSCQMTAFTRDAVE